MKINVALSPGGEAASTAISFIENRGQLADSSGAVVEEVRFYNTAAYPPTYFHHYRISFVTTAIDTLVDTPDTLHRVDMTFKNGKNDARAYGIGRQQAYHNYYLGHIPEGRARVGLYERAVQTDIYHKIDLMAYSNNAGVKYYFIIEPGGNPEGIQLKFDGQSGLEITDAGGVEIETSVGKFELPAPQAYQVDAEGGRVEVEWLPEYEIEGDSIVHFGGIEEYDEEKHLVIEVGKPTSTTSPFEDDWVEYYGGMLVDFSSDIAIDKSSNAFITGFTSSIDLTGLGMNTISGMFDAFVTKYGSDREIQWVSVVGGSGTDYGYGLDISPSQFNIAVCGASNSPDFPEAGNSPSQTSFNGIVFRLFTDDGSLTNASYYGGNGEDFLLDIHFGPQGAPGVGQLFFAGRTTSTDLPTEAQTSTSFMQNSLQGSHDAWLIKAPGGPDLSPVWLTYFGGSGVEMITDLEIADNGHIFVVGGTSSTSSSNQCTPTSDGSFPKCDISGAYEQSWSGGHPNTTDAFIAEFNENGELIWSTYIGGEEDENSIAGIFRTKIDISPSGNEIAISGLTYGDGTGSPGFPFVEVPGAYNENKIGFFVMKLENRDIVWSSSFGNGLDLADYLTDITLANDGTIFFSGTTWRPTPVSSDYYCLPPPSSFTFPACPAGGQIFFQQGNTPTFGGGSSDGFITAFDGNNYNLIWCTYFGGNGSEKLQAIEIADDGFLYLTGFTGSSVNFPLRNPVNQSVYAGGVYDAFVGALNVSTLVNNKDINVRKCGEEVFPNPTSGILQYSIFEGNNHISVSTILGQVVLEKTLETSSKANGQIDLSNYPKGIYLISNTNGVCSFTKKIILN